MAGERTFFRSLKGKFLFYFILVGLVSLTVFSGLFAYFLWRTKKGEEERARRELVEQAGEMARDLEVLMHLVEQLPQNAAVSGERVAQLLRLEGKLIDAASLVVDEQGVVVAPRPLPVRVPRSLDPTLLTEEGTSTHVEELGRMGKVFVVTRALHTEDPSFYNLAVIKPEEELAATPTGEIMRYVVIAGAAALALCIAVALYLSRSVARPLQRLSRAAWDLAHGNLDRRVEVTGNDEISSLAGHFNFMADRLQRTIQLQKDFVANVSHEIRTPLTSIEGFSQALLEGAAEEEKREHYLNIINQESRRLKRVLNQLLALSRLDAGAWVLHPGPLDLEEFLRETREKFTPPAGEKGVSLKLDLSPRLPTLLTDRDALEQVMQNLLDNAVKFTPPGGGITIAADSLPGGGARIQVRDTGPGIPPEELERIFDRFVRVEKSRSQKYGGAGLGLAVCRELAQLLGGKLTAWSRPGKGAVFTLELPPAPPAGPVSP